MLDMDMDMLQKYFVLLLLLWLLIDLMMYLLI